MSEKPLMSASEVTREALKLLVTAFEPFALPKPKPLTYKEKAMYMAHNFRHRLYKAWCVLIHNDELE